MKFFGGKEARTGRNRRGGNKRSGGRRNPHPKNASSLLTVVLLGLASLIGASGIGYLAYDDLQKIKPDRLGCYDTGEPQAQTVVLVDSSEPRFDAAQSRDLVTAFLALFESGLSFNERIRIIITEKHRIGSIPRPALELCGGASTSAELEQIGAAGSTQAFLNRQRKTRIEKSISPALDEIFATDAPPGRRQDVESPILEQIQSVSRMSGFADQDAPRRFILVADLVNNTREAQFCSVKGHLPSFSKFKTSRYYAQVKPRSLSGVDVKIYMLVRPSLGQGSWKFCTEDELVQFYQDYFADAGAASIDIVRLRDGAYVTSSR